MRVVACNRPTSERALRTVPVLTALKISASQELLKSMDVLIIRTGQRALHGQRKTLSRSKLLQSEPSSNNDFAWIEMMRNEYIDDFLGPRNYCVHDHVTMGIGLFTSIGCIHIRATIQ